MVKNPPAIQETRVQPLSWEDPWRREWQPTPVFVSGESHGQRGLVGCSPRGHKESDTTERLIITVKYDICRKLFYTHTHTRIHYIYIYIYMCIYIYVAYRINIKQTCVVPPLWQGIEHCQAFYPLTPHSSSESQAPSCLLHKENHWADFYGDGFFAFLYIHLLPKWTYL